MILDELVLHDFGVYRGRQVFDLTTPDPSRPIVLIGAQNGAGKTTFLEGLQLALYGRLSQAGFRGASGYEAYLRSTINRNASAADGASVSVAFRRSVGGQERRYRLIRSWSLKNDALREVFEVVLDDELDPVLTSQWAEFVEEMLPPRIAPLFFFDGEKIEQFADLKRSSEIISVAIKGLLGLDIVERLELDLEVLERRKLADRAKGEAKFELDEAENGLNDMSQQLEAAFTAIGGARVHHDRAAQNLERARFALKSQGGDLFASREDLAARKIQAELAVQSQQRDLRQWAGGAAPLLLVQDLLEEVHRNAQREAEAATAAQLVDHLAERDRRLLEVLSEIPHPGLMTRVEAFLDGDRMRLSDLATHDLDLQLSTTARLSLQALVDGGLNEAQAERDQLVDRLTHLEADLEGVERRVAAIPASESIEPLIAEVVRRERETAEAAAELARMEEAYAVIERELAAGRARYQARLDDHVRQSLSSEDADRLIRHSARARQTLASFKREVVSHHVHRLETLILEGLNELLSKTDLIVDVSIDPDSFEIHLKDGAWKTLSPDQLSAGERQLLAVSLLWALAKASDQAAPTVIDTPLGRLDSRHRDRLVHRYFPLAGDQVILLSTDEEVDEALYAKLEPKLSRSFTITHDAQLGGSCVTPGYGFGAKSVSEAA